MKEIVSQSVLAMLEDQPGLVALRRLASAGLSRVWQQMLKGSFGIVSAQKGSLAFDPEGRKRNQEQDAQLRDLLRHFDVGFVKMRGLWKDTELSQYIPEDSLFIANAREEDVRAIAEMYDQQAYIYGNGGMFKFQNTNEAPAPLNMKVSDYVRQIEPGEQPMGLSQIKGRGWTFDTDRGQALERARRSVEDTQREFGTGVGEAVAFLLNGGERLLKSAGNLSLTRPRVENCFYCLSQHVMWAMPLSNVGAIHPAGRTCAAFIPLREVH